MHSLFKPFARALSGALLLLCCSLSPTKATESVLHSFDINYASGAYPIGQMVLSGGLFYGTMEYGINGAGAVYTLTTTGTVKTIHEFAGGSGDGSEPFSGPITTGGNFYGTTLYGGSSNVGVVYKVTTAGVITILHSFIGYNSTTPSSSDGSYPYGGLLLGKDGNLYGTTYTGGTNNQGAVFTLHTDGTGFTLLHSFVSGSDLAYNPLTALAQAPSGVLYGTSYNYSGYNGGLYKLNTDGSGYAPVHGFNGSDPAGYGANSDLVVGKDGNLYGLNESAGANGYGTVYKIVPGSTDTISTLWAFDGFTGAYPAGAYQNYSQNKLLVDSSGNLDGVTQQGGAYGWGTAFKLTTAGVITVLGNFNLQDSHGSANPLALSGTAIYGTSFYGGLNAVTNQTNGDGSAFTIASSKVTVKTTFYIRDGYYPYSNLVQVGTGTSAEFYGTVYYGGEYGDGAIFKINSAGSYSVVHAFNNYIQEGSSPIAGLLLDTDKNLYGTTTGGGKYGYGTIFKVTTAGVLTVIHNFQYFEGYYPLAALVQGAGSDKNLYGTCYDGDPNGGGSNGSVFSTNTTGTTFRVLHYFSGSGTNGNYVECSLTPDGAGNLYGTTARGGANGVGEVFKLTTTGTTFTDLFDFTTSSTGAGYYPYYGGKLVLNAGFLYGSAQNGGKYGYGTIFKTNVSTGATTAFYSFNNANGDGASPTGSVFYDSTSGNLYGSCYNGGSSGDGTIYKILLSSGKFTLLHTFTGYNSTTPANSDGANPYGGVFLGTDGFLYETTLNGGDANYGAVIRATTTP